MRINAVWNSELHCGDQLFLQATEGDRSYFRRPVAGRPPLVSGGSNAGCNASKEHVTTPSDRNKWSSMTVLMCGEVGVFTPSRAIGADNDAAAVDCSRSPPMRIGSVACGCGCCNGSFRCSNGSDRSLQLSSVCNSSAYAEAKVKGDAKGNKRRRMNMMHTHTFLCARQTSHEFYGRVT
jgi:hypothetical protein